MTDGHLHCSWHRLHEPHVWTLGSGWRVRCDGSGQNVTDPYNNERRRKQP